MVFLHLSSRHFSFYRLKPHIFPNFETITCYICTQYVLTCTCVRYLVVHATDTEPLVHMYWRDTAYRTALQLPREDGSTSALLHIITDGARYTEHTVDVHSRRTYSNRRVTIVRSRYIFRLGKSMNILYSDCLTQFSYPACNARCGLLLFLHCHANRTISSKMY
jgi:hypothetical protein